MKNSIFRDFAKYVSLNILGMIGISCYILADTFFVAKALGATGIAALNLSISIYSIIHGIGLMVGIGGASRFSILKSQGQDQKAQSVFSTSVKLGLISGLFFVLIGIFGSEYLAFALGADMSTLPLTKTYLKTILIFAPFFILSNIMLAFVRNDNNPKLSMVAMLTGSFSNIILDYIFMFPLNLGMFGAAFATSLAPIISIFILLFHYIKEKRRFAVFKDKMVWSRVPNILGLGLSAFIIEVSSAVVLITFNLVILGLEGNLGVAAYGIVANLALIVIAIFNGLAQGSQPLASKYYGLKKYDIVAKVYRYAVLSATVMAISIYLGTALYSGNIIGIFNSENNIEIAHMADVGIKIYFIGFIFAGINIVMAMFLSATENAKSAFIISISRGMVIIVPLLLIMSRLWNMKGVWLSFVLTEFIVTIIAIYITSARKTYTLKEREYSKYECLNT